MKGTAIPGQSQPKHDSLELANWYRDRAMVLSRQNRFAESEASYREALRILPEDIEMLNELGTAVWRQGRPAEAELIYARASRIKPTDFRTLNNLGMTLYDQGMVDEAGACYRQALAINPNSFEAKTNLAVVLSDQGKLDEAMDWLRAAHELQPDSADVLQNIGMNLGRQGRWYEAIDYYQQALARKPDFAELHRNLAYAFLSVGDYQRGWIEYEWRLRCHPHPGFKINRTFWSGDNLPDRTILLHAEQGFGDILQFIRFAPMVKRRVGRVLFLGPPSLVQLISRCSGVDMAFAAGSCEPVCHVHAPLMSLPAIFGTTLDTLPNQVPYLIPDKVLVDHWGSVMAKAVAESNGTCSDSSNGAPRGRPTRPFLIGIAWQGNPATYMDRWRSFPLANFALLAELPGVRLICLQVNQGLEQRTAAKNSFPIIELPGRRGRDFMETAAIMSHLDLVISPDTAVAHLAGALGLRSWVGLSTIGEWRWICGGENDSPWYPSVRLFRQRTLGRWDHVFRGMSHALASELKSMAAVA